MLNICCSFVFLQLYHNSFFGHIPEKPLALSNSQIIQRAMKNLDRIPPYETHKVGKDRQNFKIVTYVKG